MISKIIKYPSVSLRQKATDVKFPLDCETINHIKDLHDTLSIEHGGLAVASNQVRDNALRVFVLANTLEMRSAFPGLIVINPIWEPAGEYCMISGDEGCLSFPGMVFNIKRHKSVCVKYFDFNGQSVVSTINDLAARVVQHECDHLDGKLFIDLLPKKFQATARAQARQIKQGRQLKARR